ncbi:PREDICTED: gamma-glutamylaminecyclotransferase C-like [Amphimedon queenslandica]|uniref:Gamma-glutamylcyclotransferase family protein n=1 Tax=Amphimedon queenslandica TaxID=400682 RepID=A0A1X7TJG6_AMPQE|nr:PREDICTED: gamma-glutamylaminecyclotransferase C-like [Amphimedon queenslandica]|eukprot:XP_011407415.1 PREDICTED: gamma-glutamylaminecyclotransferase C-like [Amphimedon queenslandica]
MASTAEVSSKKHRIFVYGTLKKGLRNHYLMKDKNNGEAVFISEARLSHPYPLIAEMIGDKMAEEIGINNQVVPFLLPKMPPDRPDNIVVGELYEVDSSMCAVLDKLEEHPIWYLRTPTQCILTGTPSDKFPGLSKGSTVDCEVYFYNKTDLTPEWYSRPYISDYQEN